MSFIEEYTHTLSNIDHFAPEEFHRPVALWALSGVIGRQAFTRLPTGLKVYPSLYMLMVGPSGVGKGAYKTALTGLVQPVSEESILWNEGSYEHMATCLIQAEGKLAGLSAYDEFGNILAACDPGDRNYKLNNLLMTLFETGSILRLGYKRNKEDGIEDKPVAVDSAISILGCIPPEEMENITSGQKAVNKGLLPRFLMVKSGNKQKEYKWVSPISKMKLKQLAHSMFMKIPVEHTEYIMTQEARELFVDIINGVFEERTEHPQFAAWLNRVHIKTLKVALCLACDRGRFAIIDVDDIQDASEFVGECTRSAIGMSAGSGFVMGKLNGLLKELRKGEEIPYSHIYRLTPIRTSREAKEVLHTAEDMNLLRVETKGKRRFIMGVN
jgi:hypothetical protein